MKVKLARKSKEGKTKKPEEVEDLKSQLARALADYDNLRKRTETEREVWIKFAAQTVISKLLPVLDNLESAQNHLKDQGLAIAINQFKEVIKEQGLEEVRPKAKDDFNPEIHEAVESVSGGKHGRVAETVLPGWKFEKGPVVRVAKVKVYGKSIKKRKELEKEMARGEYM